MAASATRMLLLGAVAIFEPVNGYQIRRELLSWKVDSWAHLNPGSIYGGLATLAKQGHLVRHDLDDAGRTVAVYELTEDGRAELDRLLVAGLEAVDLWDRAEFTAAFSLLPLLDRDQVSRSLEKRRAGLEDTLRVFAGADTTVSPPHATRSFLLWVDLATAELAWLATAIEDVAEGSLPVGVAEDWEPPADDPGWQMDADRQRYRELLGR